MIAYELGQSTRLVDTPTDIPKRSIGRKAVMPQTVVRNVDTLVRPPYLVVDKPGKGIFCLNRIIETADDMERLSALVYNGSEVRYKSRCVIFH